MIHWSEIAEVESFIELGNEKYASQNVVYVIGLDDNLETVVRKGATVRQLNMLSRARVLRANCQEEVSSFIKPLFSSKNNINTVCLFRWSWFDFESQYSLVNLQADHAFLNLISDLEWFRDVELIINSPSVHVKADCPDEVTNGILQMISATLSRWKLFTYSDKTT